MAESPDPCNGRRGAFAASSALSLTGLSLGCPDDWISMLASLSCVADNRCLQTRLINENQVLKIFVASQKTRNNCPPMQQVHIPFPNYSFCYFTTAFPMTGISLAHLFCTHCWEGYRGATHFEFNFLLNKDSCQTNHVFLSPIIIVKLIGLDVVDVVLVDVETKHVESWATSNLGPIFSWF